MRKMKLSSRAGWLAWQHAISEMSVTGEFSIHSYGALRVVPEYEGRGRLSPVWDDVLWAACRKDKVSAIAYSYNTPIAFCVDLGWGFEWIYPEAKYSATTSKHQSLIRKATDPVVIGTDMELDDETDWKTVEIANALNELVTGIR